MDVFAEIKALLMKELAVDEDAVVLDAHLQDDLDADSLVLMNLAETLKAEYRIELNADDLLDLELVGDLVELVKSKSPG